jgi:hypothetical protein
MISDEVKGVVSMLTVGGLVGLGQLLASKEVLTPRIIIGRVLSSAGLGATASIIVVFIPDVPIYAQFGLAAAMASLGTSALEKLLKKYLDK